MPGRGACHGQGREEMRGRGRGGSGYMLIGEEDLEGHIDDLAVFY